MLIDVLKDVAERLGAEPTAYSGRGMFGATRFALPNADINPLATVAAACRLSRVALHA